MWLPLFRRIHHGHRQAFRYLSFDEPHARIMPGRTSIVQRIQPVVVTTNAFPFGHNAAARNKLFGLHFGRQMFYERQMFVW